MSRTPDKEPTQHLLRYGVRCHKLAVTCACVTMSGSLVLSLRYALQHSVYRTASRYGTK